MLTIDPLTLTTTEPPTKHQVKEVQAKRELRFFENRHKGALAKEKASIKAEIKDNIELLAPAAAEDREKTLTAIADKAKQVHTVDVQTTYDTTPLMSIAGKAKKVHTVNLQTT